MELKKVKTIKNQTVMGEIRDLGQKNAAELPDRFVQHSRCIRNQLGRHHGIACKCA